MSVWSFKRLVKTKTRAAGLKYLLGQKERQIGNWFFKNTVGDIIKVALVLEKGLKEREQIFEASVT